jgi:hypothetical protein
MNIALNRLVESGKLHVAEARRHINPLETDTLPAPGGPKA